MFTGSDDQQGELAESGAGQTPYQQDQPGQQLPNFPDAPGVLLPADETAYEASDSVQTAAAQARSPAGDSSRDYQSSQSGSSRGRTLPVYRPADYPQQQYSPQNTVPNFRESVLERPPTAQTGPTRDYGPTQSGGGDFQNTNSAFGSTGGGRRADSGDQYVVQSRDNFWVISKRLYGSGAYFKALYEYNRRQYPRADQLRPGDVIQTPSKSILEQSYPELCPTLVQAEFATSSVGTKMVGQTVSGRMRSRLGGPIYVVEKGDTLFDIARYELGAAVRWGEIYELNRDLLGDDMDYLKPGTELVLPPAVRDEPITRRRGTSLRR